jgi:hypothetical protein
MKTKELEIDISNNIVAADNQKKTLNKPFRTPKGPKKFSVYVKNDKGNIVKVNFGDPNMSIKRDQPARRKSYRARHSCDKNPGPKWKANYWSCKMWEANKSVTDYTNASIEASQDNWDGKTFWNQDDLLKVYPDLSKADDIAIEDDAEEMMYHTQDAAEMAVGQFSLCVEKLQDLIVKIQTDPEIALEISEPWIINKIAITEHNINAIHTYLVYPRGGFLKNGQSEDVSEDPNEDISEGPESVEASSYDAGPMFMVGTKVRNINRACYHFGSEGIVTEIKELPDRMGKVISYQVTNEGPTYKKGDMLTKTPDQLTKIN